MTKMPDLNQLEGQGTKMRMAEVEDRADQLSIGAGSRIVKKTLTEMCNSQFVRNPFISKSSAATLHSNWFRKLERT